MLTVMTFPPELSVFVREKTNGCYSCLSYYIAKTVVDLPLTLLNVVIFISIVWHTTGQIDDTNRFLLMMAVMILMTIVGEQSLSMTLSKKSMITFSGQSTGLLFGSLWAHKPDEAVFVAPVSALPVFLLSGFFVKVSTMPRLVYCSYTLLMYTLIVLHFTVICNRYQNCLTGGGDLSRSCSLSTVAIVAWTLWIQSVDSHWRNSK